jgi:hypothetical protein
MVYVFMAALQTPSPAPGYLVYWSSYPAEIIEEQELNEIFSKRSLFVFWSPEIKGEQQLNKNLVCWSFGPQKLKDIQIK